MKTSTFLPVVMALVAQVAATPVDKVEKRDFTIPGICNLGQWGVSLDLNKLCKESCGNNYGGFCGHCNGSVCVCSSC